MIAYQKQVQHLHRYWLTPGVPNGPRTIVHVLKRAFTCHLTFGLTGSSAQAKHTRKDSCKPTSFDLLGSLPLLQCRWRQRLAAWAVRPARFTLSAGPFTTILDLSTSSSLLQQHCNLTNNPPGRGQHGTSIPTR